jgi:hypothetical protein
MIQNKEQVLRIAEESNNLQQLKESINRTTENKFRQQIEQQLDYCVDLGIHGESTPTIKFVDKVTDADKIVVINTITNYYSDPSIANHIVTDDNIVTNNKNDDGEYVEIDYSKLKPDTDYLVTYDNQEYIVKSLKDGKVRFAEVKK